MEYIGQRSVIGIVEEDNAAGLDVHEKDWACARQTIARLQDNTPGICVEISDWLFHREGWHYKSLRIYHPRTSVAFEIAEKIEEAIDYLRD